MPGDSPEQENDFVNVTEQEGERIEWQKTVMIAFCNLKICEAYNNRGTLLENLRSARLHEKYGDEIIEETLKCILYKTADK